MNAKDILARGYFPRELPPPFNTDTFAAHVASSSARPAGFGPAASAKPVVTKPAIHNLARAGSLRRRLSIPNPIAYDQLADVVATNWAVLLSHTANSPIALTTPKATAGTKRAIVPTHDFDAWPSQRARTRAGKRYVLKADLATFYSSVYTHSIPWAIHGKSFAKADRRLSHLGNLLDTVVRNGQDQQTNGIPIGPDTSLLIAEILLTSVDKFLPASMCDGIRYVDDYEFGFTTYSEAESCLAALQELLSTLELQLNPLKTSILALPLPLEEFWTPDLRLYEIRSSTKAQATDLVSFFGKAFHLQPSCPDDSILKYAVARTRSETIQPENWALYEALLLQAATVEPGTLSIVVELLVRYFRAGYAVNVANVANAFNAIIEVHSAIGHGSEVAWALWGSIELGGKVGATAAQRLSASDDPVVVLITLDAKARGLVNSALDTTRWQPLMTSPELRGSSWLLVYEAFIKGWLPGAGGVDPIAPDPYFSWLLNGGVSFYEATRALPTHPVAYTPPVLGVSPSGPGSGPSAGDVVVGETTYQL
jgi:hypothetical protein